jgi:hypothetical protein
LVCGWPITCTPSGDAVIPNGTTYVFDLDLGSQRERFTFSCVGCGGGSERVNTIWTGARCGATAIAGRQDLCLGDNVVRPVIAPRCCGCAGDVCTAQAPTCVDGTCK